MIEAFRHFISANQLCTVDDHILLAVSGGVDSVVLLDLFCRSGYQVSVAHCNFQLRGADSDGDETFVRELSLKYKVPYFVKVFETAEFANETGQSIQETARRLRYDWFEQLAQEKQIEKIAIAHHLDDQVETFLINTIRGSGVQGLKGMPMQRGKIIRPLLFAGRAEIEAYARKRKINFREDASNKSDKYLRNRIRNRLIPEFLAADPRSMEGIQKSLSFLTEDAVILMQLIDEKRKSMLIRNGEYLTIRKTDLLALQPVETWSYYLLFPFGFNRDSTNSIARSSERGESGKMFGSETHELLVDRDFLYIRDRQKEASAGETWINEDEREIQRPVRLSFKRLTPKEFHALKPDARNAWFDLEKLVFPLKLRTWQQGDRFRPIGMKGSKLVSDFLTDKKINQFEKDRVMVLLSDNEIIWVVGYRSSEKYKVDDQTTSVYEIQSF